MVRNGNYKSLSQMVVFLRSPRQAVAVQTWSSTFGVAFRSGLKLISGAGVGSFLRFHSMFLSYLLCE